MKGPAEVPRRQWRRTIEVLLCPGIMPWDFRALSHLAPTAILKGEYYPRIILR